MKKERQGSEWVSIQELYGKNKRIVEICDTEGEFLERVDQVADWESRGTGGNTGDRSY